MNTVSNRVIICDENFKKFAHFIMIKFWLYYETITPFALVICTTQAHGIILEHTGHLLLQFTRSHQSKKLARHKNKTADKLGNGSSIAEGMNEERCL